MVLYHPTHSLTLCVSSSVSTPAQRCPHPRLRRATPPAAVDIPNRDVPARVGPRMPFTPTNNRAQLSARPRRQRASIGRHVGSEPIARRRIPHRRTVGGRGAVVADAGTVIENRRPIRERRCIPIERVTAMQRTLDRAKRSIEFPSGSVNRCHDCLSNCPAPYRTNTIRSTPDKQSQELFQESPELVP